MYGSSGERLDSFLKITVLGKDNAAAWKFWIERPETDTFLDETVLRCATMADIARNAAGYFRAQRFADEKPDPDGGISQALDALAKETGRR